MKIISILIGIIGFQYMSFSQNIVTIDNNSLVTNCSVNYSEDLASLVYGGSSKITCREITISSIPPQTQSVAVVDIDFGATGTFTFIKDESLQLYNDKDVYIEDMLTGKLFDLKASSNYSFNVNRKVPERFILHIDKMLYRYSVSSN
ncbi:hypothetical protein [Aurantibacillus circumpalustris]|uniref:hypothetical protein n=1 Tax=Aurantibacillus circumpalustris TaxID=3036359 RepID=UPI00295A660D|nr:hypothetical protein [Aurantibacillus circumpalustris]